MSTINPNRTQVFFKVTALLVLALLATAPWVRAQEAAREYFTDTVLVDQEGREQRFFSDLLAGKVVVIDTIFTRCTGVCPVLSRNMEKIQEHLGDRVGRDVHLISISVDPLYDTPQRLKEFARRYHAQHGWYFLTGQPQDVNFILERLGQKVPSKENHKSLMLVGNVPAEYWKKALGLASPQELIEIVDSVLQDQGKSASP
ncbi:MAG TPA: SCO family protein [Acidobacteriota bacterium]|nr:SCO family protein [Acidobacteriota bacterium]